MSFPGEFNEALLKRFIQLIATHTGLHIRPEERKALAQKICLRMKLFNISVPEIYYSLLKNSTHQSYDEWQELAILLTVGESYFFRDKGQFSLLQTYILPQLIAAQQKTKTLRIWSAGCSTGEEPYSLAILLKQLIPDCDKWNIFIFGTDINQKAINQAKKGIYPQWSFRLVQPDIQNLYFYKSQSEWHIKESIRQMVTFQPLNLIEDTFFDCTSKINNIDLILCRNVFIYFDKQAISVVLNKFYNALKPGGYLLTAHGELQGQDLDFLETKVFPESIIYKRRENGAVEAKNSDNLHFAPFSTIGRLRLQNLPSQAESGNENNYQSPIYSKSPFERVFIEAETLFYNKYYDSAIKKAEQLISWQPQHCGAYYLLSQIYANVGEYEKAIDFCQKAIALDSLAVEPLYLLAHIAEETGDIEKAKKIFKQIIYLLPSSISAYLELGYIYQNEGDKYRADKMRKVALEILKKLPSESNVK